MDRPVINIHPELKNLFFAAMLADVDINILLAGLIKARCEAEGEFENEEDVESLYISKGENGSPSILHVTYSRGEIKRESDIVLDNSVFANQKECSENV